MLEAPGAKSGNILLLESPIPASLTRISGIRVASRLGQALDRKPSALIFAPSD
jgi:hypothetical protein